MTARCTGTTRGCELEDGSQAGAWPRDGPTHGHLHLLEDGAGALGSCSKDG